MSHLFINYSHRDNLPVGSGTKGWVDLLYEALDWRLSQLLHEGPKISRSGAHEPNHTLTSSIASVPAQPAILISVVSPAYVDSKWCRAEVQQFLQFARQRVDEQTVKACQIFRVVKQAVSQEITPPELQGTPEYKFYDEDALNSQHPEFNPVLTESGENDRRYWEKFEDLAIAIRAALVNLEALSFQAKQQDPGAPVKAIYLAETTSDRTAERDSVRRTLEQHGYVVFPDRELPRTTASDLEAATRDYLQRSLMSVHLIGAIYGFVTELDDRSIVRIQQELALAHSGDPEFKRLIWIPDGIEAREPRQEAFIKHLQDDSSVLRRCELVAGNIEVLKSTIHEALSPKSKSKAVESATPGSLQPSRVYLVYHEQDYLETKSILQHLVGEKLEVLVPVNKTKLPNPREHKELLLLADAVMVYYGRVNDEWSRQKLRELQKLPGYSRGKSLLAKAFYLSAPPTDDKEEFFTYEADVIKAYQGFEPNLLAPFVSKIRSGNQRSAGHVETEEFPEVRRAKVNLFYSYSHKDETFREQLETHLKLLQYRGLIEAWHDRQIRPGNEFDVDIDEHLERADVILLLVSADFIASDYCYKKEMTRALERHTRGEARVIPIIVRDVDWSLAPFSKLQALPKDGRAVKLWNDRDAAWRNVSEGIKKVVEQLRVE
jgi:TIR domain-containing protein